ncbi:hypothetical protein CVIRNUC_000004 [Coccomyxa viridis]|uniref:Uncharacterized protein n=1 Tax=Coccomyxa viridis TaxID=1274662 RepID=A0AAV1HPC5_9CHLO|nr:hypothetical protein CVIRNUC_000004 [Coccomyxa viridis]
MDPVERQLETLNSEIADLTAKTEAAWDAFISATDPQQKTELKERYIVLNKEKEDCRSERHDLQLKLPSSEAKTPGLIAKGLQSFAAAAWGSPHKAVDGWMHAPGGTCFLGDADLGSTLYVREAYVALQEKLEELKKKGTAHVVISGNPGLGKSWFALYMLVRWLGDKIPVLWHQPRQIYLFEGSTVRKLSTDEAVEVMQSCAVPGLRYIADGAAPLVPKPWVEQSLVAHSPDDSKYKEYLKPRGHEKGPLWMPFWEPDELEALRAKHFAKEVSSVEMQQLIDRRGAVPRLVLDAAHNHTMDVRIKQAIGSLQPSDIIAAEPSTAHAFHRLVRIHPTRWRQGDFGSYELTFLSTDIEQKVVDKVLEIMSSNMAALMQLTRSSHAQLAGVMAATIVETWTHGVLQKGARLLTRVCPRKGFRGAVDESLVDSSMDAGGIALELSDRAAASSTWELELPALSEHRFSKVEDLQSVSTEDKYLRPPKSFPAIDSIAIVGGTAYLVQITQDLKHDINVGLLSVLACLPSHLDVKFVWALPDDLWGQETFNARDVPEIADLSSPMSSRGAGSKRIVKTVKASMPVTDESAKEYTAAEPRSSRVSKEAIMQLVDRDVALVERRVAACKRQYKIAIPLTRDAPQASLSIASSLARSSASAPWGSCLGPRVFRQLPARALPALLPPAKALVAGYPVRRPFLKVTSSTIYVAKECSVILTDR